MPGSKCHFKRKEIGLFAGEPNPFTAEECGALPLLICWASDHSGTLVNRRCQHRADLSRLVVIGD